MELTYLPEEKATKRIYRHYTINSQLTPDQTGERKTEFFYIGRQSSNIDLLIEAIHSGYAAESTADAYPILNRLLQTQRQAMPDVIIAEATVGIESLRQLHEFMASHPSLAAIPLVVEASGLASSGVAKLKNCSFIDDIISLQDPSGTSIFRKVSFLKKVKQNLITENNKRIHTALSQEGLPRIAFGKRAFDIGVSSLLLLLLSPIFLIIALAIRLESKGPIFYISKRAGRGYRIFDFFKFRTMLVGADARISEYSHLNQYSAGNDGPLFFKIDNDPRITRVGNFLRNTSLDELPQLLNVLLGDMSLVGNRPLPLYEAATLTTDEWAKRFMAPAGLTGLWQIKKRGKKDMSIEERITLDIDYANRYGFLVDLWIIANTPTAIIQKTNA